MQNNLQQLCDKNLPFTKESLPEGVYLVGGAVRDALLNREREYLDLDLVLTTQAVETARKIANRYQAGFVLLDRDRQIARVVFKHLTIDFAQLEGDSIETDLQRRDFTINAIAYNPHNGKIIDPLKGQVDLENKLLRMVKTDNLCDDPLRLLRAYRQAAQLNFTIEETTKQTLITLAPLLAKVAAERVKTELHYLLATPEGTPFLAEAIKDGLISVWLKNATVDKIEELAKIEQEARWIEQIYPELAVESKSWYSLAKLASLTFSHKQEAELELITLKCSRAEIRAVITLLEYLPQLLGIGSMSLKEQYLLFLNVGEVFPLLAVLALAKGANRSLIASLLTRYFNPSDQVAHPQRLVTGNELMQALKLSSSPKIGELLTAVQIAYIEGKIFTREEAFKLAEFLISDV